MSYWSDLFSVFRLGDAYWYEAMPSHRRNWVCKDGRVVAFVDMNNNHLANAIAMLRRIADKNSNQRMPLRHMLNHKLWKRAVTRHKRATAWADRLQEELDRRNQC